MQRADFTTYAKKMPDAPGVYFFLDKRKKILYIGKATSLRSRVRSYFSTDLHETRGPLLVSMVERAASVEWRQTDSVLEALILEAHLIRNYKPEHNTDLKDDKSFTYVVITKEDYPRVLLVRGKELALKNAPVALYTFGPFPHGLQLKEALKIIRKIFPYRDSCIPATEMMRVGKKPKACFNHALGLCPGVCAGSITKTDYRKQIRRIALLFQGKKTQLLMGLKKDKATAAREERFEDAALVRRQLFALTHIQDISLIKDEYRSPLTGHELSTQVRIEAYDVAHFGGSSNVGVMTVVEDGEANTPEYRKFRIRLAKPGDDVGALREILYRRLAHTEWQLPRIIAVDGSRAQIHAAEAVVQEYGMGIPVVGVVKDEKHRPRNILGDRSVFGAHERAILLANAEAHRYAIAYHRKRLRAERGI